MPYHPQPVAAQTGFNLPETPTDQQIAKYDEATERWVASDLPAITPDNLASDVGDPAAGLPAEKTVYIQIDAAPGTNDVWTRADNTQPWVATHKTTDPATGRLTDFGDAVQELLPKSWAAKTLSDWAATMRYKSYHMIDANFDFGAFMVANPGFIEGSTLFIANQSRTSGYAIAYPATHGLRYKEVGTGQSAANIAAGSGTDFSLGPSQVVVMSYDATTVYASISDARDKGPFADQAALTAFPSNALGLGDIATIGAQLWVYDPSSTTDVDVNVLRPDDNPPTGRWYTSPTGRRTSLYQELSTWTLRSSTGAPMAPIRQVVRHNKQCVIISDTIGNGWHFLDNAENLPLEVEQELLIEFARVPADETDPANPVLPSTFGIRLGRPGVVSDVVINPDTGEVTRSHADARVLSVRKSGEFIEIRIRYTPRANYSAFQLYPGYGVNGATGSAAGATGEIAISRLEMNHHSKEVPSAHVVDGLMVDAAPTWTDEQSIAHGTTEVVSTGVNLDDVEKLIVHFERTNGTWPTSKIVDVSKIRLGIVQGAMMVHFDGTYLGIRNMTAAQKTAGDIPFYAFGIAGNFGFEITKIEFKKRAVGVSRRLGEMVHMKSTRFVDDAAAMVQGYLPVKPGTVANGAASYPLWAAMYPEFVSGADIVFPADVDGIFLRNIGGNAGVEGDIQSDQNQAHTHTVTDTNHPNFTGRGTGSNVARNGIANTTRTTSSNGGVEARPVNRAYQLYTIVDSYVEISPTVAPTVVNDNSEHLTGRTVNGKPEWEALFDYPLADHATSQTITTPLSNFTGSISKLLSLDGMSVNGIGQPYRGISGNGQDDHDHEDFQINFTTGQLAHTYEGSWSGFTMRLKVTYTKA